MNIVISSGKGGTGKTFVSTNLALTLLKSKKQVAYLDCDVEEPNGHLFLKPKNIITQDVTLLSPMGVDAELCLKCGKCVEACTYNALAHLKDKILFFAEMCHVCGACQVVCPSNAIIEKNRNIGEIITGMFRSLPICYATLKTGEGGMAVKLINEVKKRVLKDTINVLDSPPGTACPVVATVKDADLTVLVTDPTPFGINDLKLAVNMCRAVGQEPVVVVNRAEYFNDDLKKYCAKENLEIIAEIPHDRKIAEVYSVGDLVVEKLPEYRGLFETLSNRIFQLAKEKRVVRMPTKKIHHNLVSFYVPAVKQEHSSIISCKYPKTSSRPKISWHASGNHTKPTCAPNQRVGVGVLNKELVVVSGKGGTGKTSLLASFVSLEKKQVICDCDVDAADLHLVLNPRQRASGGFSGGAVASIAQDICVGCGSCEHLCRFDAIKQFSGDQGIYYQIDPVSCEGCGLCSLVCPAEAVMMQPAINGEWFVSETAYGPMSHAVLGVAEENSGKLVSLVRKNASLLAEEEGLSQTLMDGAPGTGCPVIASLTGVHYAVVVTEPTISGLHDLKRVLDVIRHFRVKAGVVVNKYDINQALTEKIIEECEEMGVEFLGQIPYDQSVTHAQMKGMSVIDYGENETTRSIKQIWQKINTITKGEYNENSCTSNK